MVHPSGGISDVGVDLRHVKRLLFVIKKHMKLLTVVH